jgi:hypothetical protein
MNNTFEINYLICVQTYFFVRKLNELDIYWIIIWKSSYISTYHKKKSLLKYTWHLFETKKNSY